MTNAGNVAFRELEPDNEWSNVDGWSTLRRWLGHKSLLDDFLPTIPGGYNRLNITRDEVSATVTATYPAIGGDSGGGTTQPDPISTHWGLTSNAIQQDIWASPKLKPSYDYLAGLAGGAGNALLADIRKAIDEGLQNYTAPAALSLVSPEGQLEPFRELYVRLLKNITAIPESQYVLRKALLVSTASEVEASHTNVNKAHTYSQLVAAEPTLPYAILIDPGHEVLQSLKWVKQTPDIGPTTGGRWEIKQEYWGVADHDTWVIPNAS